MKVVFDTDNETLEDLYRLLDVVKDAISKRSGNTNEIKKEVKVERKIDSNPHTEILKKQDEIMKNLHMESIYQSDFGLRKKRGENLRR